jgi:HlyD family secretion protein
MALMAMICVALALMALAAWAWRRTEVGVVQVVRQDLVQSVVASGRVQAPNRVDVGAQMVGTVARVRAAAGEAVAQGQVLLELEASELAANQLAADAAAQLARERVRQLEEVQVPLADLALRQADITRSLARATLSRNWALFQQGFIGQAALEESARQLVLSEAQMRQLAQQYQALLPGGSEAAAANAAWLQAQAGAYAARSRRAYSRVLAPSAGLVMSRQVEVGDVVQPGRALMTLAPTGRTELLVHIDERNVHWLALGQKARASVDAYPEQRFVAQVSFISPAVNAQTGAVEVRLQVPEPPPYLRQDMTASVDIEVARRAQAVLVPAVAVQGLGSARPTVLVADGAQLRSVTLEIGLQSAGAVEVLRGLSPGDWVALEPDGLSAGQRIKPVPAALSLVPPRAGASFALPTEH